MFGKSRGCILCYSIDLYSGPGCYPSQCIPKEIISCCAKLLSPEIVTTVKWLEPLKQISYFCDECHVNTKRLAKLNIQYEELGKELHGLVGRISRQINIERSCYVHSDSAGDSKIYPEEKPKIIKASHHEAVPLTASPNIDGRAENSESILEEQERPDDDDDCDNFEDHPLQCFDENDIGDLITIEVDNVVDHPTQSPSQDIENPSPNKSENKTSSPKKQPIPTKTKSNSPPKVSKNQPSRYKKKTKRIIIDSKLTLERSSDFVCTKCGKNFSKQLILDSHDCGRPTCECEICGKAFANPYVLKRHYRSHTGEQPYKCNVCGKSFSIGYNLNRHMRVHTGEKPYACEICNMKFTNKQSIKSHISVVHSNEKPFECDVCGKTFKIKDRLRRHRLSHLRETSTVDFVQCDVCHLPFRSKFAVSVHQSRSNCHLKAVEDGIVNKLMGNEHSISTKKEVVSITCDICSVSFRTKSALNVHTPRCKKKHQVKQEGSESPERKSLPRRQCRNSNKRHKWSSSSEDETESSNSSTSYESDGDKYSLIKKRKYRHQGQNRDPLDESNQVPIDDVVIKSEAESESDHSS